MIRMKLSVSEVMSLAAWVEKHGLRKEHEVELEQDSAGGVGNSTNALIKMTHDEGIFKDITDYDLW